MVLLKSFLLDDGKDVVQLWYEQEPPKVRAKLDTIMVHLRQYSRDQKGGWVRPTFDTLDGGEGVGEIRFKHMNVLYRPLGYFGPYRNEFTFLYFALEKSDRFMPRNALELAIERKRLVDVHPQRAKLVRRWHQ